MIYLFGSKALLTEAKQQTKELQTIRRLLFRQTKPGAFVVSFGRRATTRGPAVLPCIE